MTFLSALLLGLLASAHCAAMCGGLQSALQQTVVIRSAQQAYFHLLALNLGRLSIYCLAGSLVALLGGSIVDLIDLPMVARTARYFTALVLILIGIQLLLPNIRLFAWLELLTKGWWQRVQQYMPQSDSSRPGQSYLRGLIWGFLPCGLVYSVLLTTLFADGSLQGMLIMLGFGLGTLPAMLLTGGLYLHLRTMIRNKAVQIFAGIIFVQGGVLMITAPWFTDMEFMRAYPQLMSGLFCIS
jgi:sulfite exporter TauE/SafE